MVDTVSQSLASKDLRVSAEEAKAKCESIAFLDPHTLILGVFSTASDLSALACQWVGLHVLDIRHPSHRVRMRLPDLKDGYAAVGITITHDTLEDRSPSRRILPFRTPRQDAIVKVMFRIQPPPLRGNDTPPAYVVYIPLRVLYSRLGADPKKRRFREIAWKNWGPSNTYFMKMDIPSCMSGTGEPPRALRLRAFGLVSRSQARS